MATKVPAFKQYIGYASSKKDVAWPADKKILIIGYGSVGQAILPTIMKHICGNGKQITVLERGENEKVFKERNKGNGVNYVKKEILRNNLDKTLAEHVGDNGFIVDVSLNIGVEEILEWAWQHDCNYINTSLERWADQPDETIPRMKDRTLFAAHRQMRKVAEKYPNAPTATVTHGANPGLVTHLTKRALLKLAEKKGKKANKPADREGWAKLMKSLGVKVVHIAERDTQIIDEPKEKNEFVNTWSPEGFWAEGRAPAEMGWGTHEDAHPENGAVQGNTAFVKEPGLAVLVKSWVPLGGQFNGFLVQHSEAVTISEYFTTKDESFRPTVHYVYQPCDAAIASVHELRGRELDMQYKQRVIKDEIISGIDELGVLLIGDDFACWHGSQLSIEEARKLIPGENATSLQVIASMLGAMIWAIENPNRGYVEPEEIDHEFVLKHADPYLGPIAFEMTDWRPNKDTNSLFYREYNEKNPCSLENFRVWS